MAIAGSKGSKDRADFVANALKSLENLFLGSFGVGGVLEGPVVAVGLAGKSRAGLIGIAADGDHGIDIALKKFVELLGAVIRDVYSYLFERGNGLGVDITGGIRACAGNFEQIAGGLAEYAFAHVAAAGVSGAEDEDKWFISHWRNLGWE